MSERRTRSSSVLHHIDDEELPQDHKNRGEEDSTQHDSIAEPGDTQQEPQVLHHTVQTNSNKINMVEEQLTKILALLQVHNQQSRGDSKHSKDLKEATSQNIDNKATTDGTDTGTDKSSNEKKLPRSIRRRMEKRQRHRNKDTSHKPQEASSESDSEAGNKQQRRNDYAIMNIIPKNRDRDLQAVRDHKSLADTTEPIQWLLNFIAYADTRQWMEQRFCHMLPLVWAKQDETLVTYWADSLSQKVRKSRTKLEKAFIKKFASNDIIIFEATLLRTAQPENSSCEDWFIKISQQHAQLRTWVPHKVYTKERFFRVITSLFTNDDMITLINTNMEDSDTSEGEFVLSMKEIIRLCKRADTLTRKRNKQRHRREQTRTHTSILSIQDHIMNAEFENIDDEMEETAELTEYYAEMDVLNTNAPRISIRLVQTALRERRKREGPMPQAISFRREEDMKEFSNVMHRNHQRTQGQICPFNATKFSGCNNTRCTHEHKQRSRDWCTEGKTDTQNCVNGAWCAKRHKNDEYVIWFYDRYKKGFKQYLWKDLKSTFSAHRQ